MKILGNSGVCQGRGKIFTVSNVENSIILKRPKLGKPWH